MASRPMVAGVAVYKFLKFFSLLGERPAGAWRRAWPLTRGGPESGKAFAVLAAIRRDKAVGLPQQVEHSTDW